MLPCPVMTILNIMSPICPSIGCLYNFYVKSLLCRSRGRRGGEEEDGVPIPGLDLAPASSGATNMLAGMKTEPVSDDDVAMSEEDDGR